MIAGASWGWWLGFHGAVVTLLLVDAFLPANRREEPRTQATAWIWTGVLVAATALFAIWIAVGQSHHNALEFVAGY
ncbi:MAG: branched-chain amino acid ABC transporter substrate-binding protein, partial [Terracidiphilus sp.]